MKASFISALYAKYDGFQGYLPLSFVCHQWGTHQYHNGKKTEGRKFLIDALKFVYMWSGAVEVLDIKDYAEEIKQNKINAASEGGKHRAKKYDPIKIRVVELLKKRAPEGGWKTKAAAIEALSSDFEDSWDKMHRTIEDWSRNDEEIKSVFAVVVQKK
ncbi:hypothetical protein [Budvicia aquatica]|nr:hypothetical protein [Budvicia aquatica]VFS51574.1 Uncharacterised protein [Budvicia aquatica]